MARCCVRTTQCSDSSGSGCGGGHALRYDLGTLPPAYLAYVRRLWDARDQAHDCFVDGRFRDRRGVEVDASVPVVPRLYAAPGGYALALINAGAEDGTVSFRICDEDPGGDWRWEEVVGLASPGEGRALEGKIRLPGLRSALVVARRATRPTAEQFVASGSRRPLHGGGRSRSRSSTDRRPGVLIPAPAPAGLPLAARGRSVGRPPLPGGYADRPQRPHAGLGGARFGPHGARRPGNRASDATAPAPAVRRRPPIGEVEPFGTHVAYGCRTWVARLPRTRSVARRQARSGRS